MFFKNPILQFKLKKIKIYKNQFKYTNSIITQINKKLTIKNSDSVSVSSMPRGRTSQILPLKSKQSYTNFLTLKNDCKIYHPSSSSQLNIKSLPHLNPENILSENIRQVWLSNQLPAKCIIDLRQIIDKPMYFNRIGFNCWHQYESNPQIIEIYSLTEKQGLIQYGLKKLLAKFRLDLTNGWQHFKLPFTISKNISFLELAIIKNQAEPEKSDNQNDEQNANNVETNTYLNQISMGFVEQIEESRVDSYHALNNIQTNNLNNANNMREKTFSDYRKLTSSEKQIKRLNEKVKQLTSENEMIKNTIKDQNIVISKLQLALQRLTENVIKIQHSIQENQRRDRLNYDQLNRQNKQLLVEKHHQKQRFDSYSNEQESVERKFQRKYNSKQKARPRNNGSHYQREHQQLNLNDQFRQSQLSKPHSVYNKSGKEKSQQRSTHSKRRQIINAKIQSSQNSLSEYQGVNSRAYNYKKKSHQDHFQGQNKGNNKENKQKKQIQMTMIETLQKLIMKRDEKVNILKSQKKQKKAQRVHISSQDQQESEEQY